MATVEAFPARPEEYTGRENQGPDHQVRMNGVPLQSVLSGPINHLFQSPCRKRLSHLYN